MKPSIKASSTSSNKSRTSPLSSLQSADQREDQIESALADSRIDASLSSYYQHTFTPYTPPSIESVLKGTYTSSAELEAQSIHSPSTRNPLWIFKPIPFLSLSLILSGCLFLFWTPASKENGTSSSLHTHSNDSNLIVEIHSLDRSWPSDLWLTDSYPLDVYSVKDLQLESQVQDETHPFLEMESDVFLLL